MIQTVRSTYRWFASVLAVRSRNLCRAAFVGAAVASVGLAGSIANAEFLFLTPSGWTAGDVGSTYQQWSFLSASAPGPDAGYQANPTIATAPAIGVNSPGFVTSGSGNFYSFGGDYSWHAGVPNHGGSGGGSYPSGVGTHVMVQTASTMNGISVYPNSLNIVTPAGDPIPGGANVDALRSDVSFFESGYPSPFGAVNYEGLIWEFYLPNYTGDFRVVANQVVHSSLDQLRVDSMLSDTAYAITPVPEPASIAGLAIGAIVFGVAKWKRRRGRRSGDSPALRRDDEGPLCRS